MKQNWSSVFLWPLVSIILLNWDKLWEVSSTLLSDFSGFTLICFLWYLGLLQSNIKHKTYIRLYSRRCWICLSCLLILWSMSSNSLSEIASPRPLMNHSNFVDKINDEMSKSKPLEIGLPYPVFDKGDFKECKMWHGR